MTATMFGHMSSSSKISISSEKDVIFFRVILWLFINKYITLMRYNWRRKKQSALQLWKVHLKYVLYLTIVS